MFPVTVVSRRLPNFKGCRPPTPLEAPLKYSTKNLASFVVLLALTWVFLSLGMEVFLR